MKKNSLNKSNLIKAAALLVMASGVNAASLSGGNLVLNLDHDVFQAENTFTASDGTTATTYIEHYYDAATANSLKGFELVRNNRDESDSYYPVTSTQNLSFDMNGETVTHPLTDNPNLPGSAQHYLQKTDFEFDSEVGLHDSATGQIGFGGMLRVGFGNLDNLPDSPEYDPTLGVIGLGDFSMMHDATEGWVIHSTTGVGGGTSSNPSAPTTGPQVFSTKNTTADTSVDGKLTITGDLFWTTIAIANGDELFANGAVEAGTFTMTADVVASTDVSGGTGAAVVPVPAAVWLFGTGLIGLVGVGRSKTKMA